MVDDNVIKEDDYTIMNDNVIQIVGYRTEEQLPEDHFAIDGYRADVLISPDTLEYLQKINEVVMEGEAMWFKSLTTCRYDPYTGDVYDVSD